jgi:hypothetical protein
VHHSIPWTINRSGLASPPPLVLQLKRADVPLELEEIGLPMNTFGPKNPFTGKVRLPA